jgi:hypothetical protein
MKTCFKCGATVELEKVGRRDECPGCGNDLRVCLNCAFYAEARANACMEPQAERVQEKDRANYCDFFRFKETAQKKSGKTEAEKRWEELFKKR